MSDAIRHRLLATTILTGCALAAAPAHAQSQSGPQPAPDAPVQTAQPEDETRENGAREDQTMERIVVTGQRGALNRALAAERDADNLVSVIMADDIGQFADQNVAESLQRVSGITLNRSEGEGRSVSVRGLPSGFTPVTVNGVRLGSTHGTTDQVSLDSVGNAQLEEVEVTKSALPSQDADSIGGVIDLRITSAFTRRDDLFQVRAEGFYNANAREVGPSIDMTLTRRFLDGRLGFAATLAYSQRPTYGWEVEPDSGLGRVAGDDQDGPGYLRHNRIDTALETGERTRWNGSFNLEYRPRDDVEFFLRGTYNHLNDYDLAFQDIWEINRSTGSRIVETRPGGGEFFRTRQAKRLFFQDIDNEVGTLAAGGSFQPMGWDVEYQLNYSYAQFDNPNGMRGRFRADRFFAEVASDKRNLTLIPGVGDGGQDPYDASLFEFNQLLYVQQFRTDETIGGNIDIGRDFAAFDAPARIDFGGKARIRERDNVREEFTANPGSFGIDASLADLPLWSVNSPLGHRTFYPEEQATFDFFTQTRDQLLQHPEFQRIDLSHAGDFVIEEDIYSAYVQGSIEPAPGLMVIGGVRMEHTETNSQGYFVEFDSSGRGPDGEPNTGDIIDLGFVANSYTDWFPGIHLRWEATDTIIARASANRALQRPNFGDMRNSLRVQIDENDPETRDLYANNPYLRPLMANQFDASVAWYPDENTAFQASIFYKDIDDFFFNFEGDGGVYDQLPIEVPAGVDTNFRRIETVLNGESADVYGLELSYVQSYTFLPGLLSGLFTQANLTFVDSDATIAVRGDETFTLPGQRDVVGNVSLGWEDDNSSVRLAANYQGKALVVLASEEHEDVYTDPSLTFDLNLRHQLTDSVRLNFDVINLTDEREIEYYRGDQFGALLYTSEDYGRIFRFGVRARF